MESRLNKYKDIEDTPINSLSREEKNATLYDNIKESEIDNFDINSNATVIGVNSNIIDIDKLKDMLDKKYRDDINPRPIVQNDIKKQEPLNLDETRQYDINAILNEAKKEEEVNYEVERYKKLRNTQTDILNSLKLDKKEDNAVVSSKESEKLKELINTINITEAAQREQQDPLDLINSLKGDNDATKVMGIPPINATLEETIADLTKEDSEEKEDSDATKQNFTTTTSAFTTTDFSDFDDLKEDVTATKVIVRILIIIVIIAFAIGALFLLNKMLGWGLF